MKLPMALKFYNSVAKGLKLKVRKFWKLIPTFVKFTWKNSYGEGAFLYLIFTPSVFIEATKSETLFITFVIISYLYLI